MALGHARKVRPLLVGEKHYRKARFFRGGPEPFGAAVREHFYILVQERDAHAEHAGLASPSRQQRRGLWITQRNAPHHSKAGWIALGRFKAVIVAVARPRGRHDHYTIDTGFVHYWQQLLNGEGLGHLRLHAWHPRPVRAGGLPQVDLGVDDLAFTPAACCLTSGCGECTGAQGASNELAACRHDERLPKELGVHGLWA